MRQARVSFTLIVVLLGAMFFASLQSTSESSFPTGNVARFLPDNPDVCMLGAMEPTKAWCTTKSFVVSEGNENGEMISEALCWGYRAAKVSETEPSPDVGIETFTWEYAGESEHGSCWCGNYETDYNKIAYWYRNEEREQELSNEFIVLTCEVKITKTGRTKNLPVRVSISVDDDSLESGYSLKLENGIHSGTIENRVKGTRLERSYDSLGNLFANRLWTCKGEGEECVISQNVLVPQEKIQPGNILKIECVSSGQKEKKAMHDTHFSLVE